VRIKIRNALGKEGRYRLLVRCAELFVFA
jgi:hypothetical protein